MNWGRFSFTKQFSLVAAVVPGLALLAIIGGAHPELFRMFQNFPFFGYKSKLAMLLLVAFGIGLPLDSLHRVLQIRFIFPSMGRASRRITEHNDQVSANTRQILPWDSEIWRCLVRQLVSTGLPENAPPKDETTIWKDLWKCIDTYQWLEWNIVERRPLRTIAHSFTSAAILLLLGSFWVPGLHWWWTAPFAATWTILLWTEPFLAMTQRSLFERERDQLTFLMRIVVTKAAPNLKVS